jgi:hypothetical protein
MAKIKCLVGKGKRFLVETKDKESYYLVSKMVEPRGEGVETEWVFSYESPLVKPLLGKGWSQLVFGACVKELGIIHIFLDNILKAFNINGFEPVEEWFGQECSKHLIHELTHYLAPEWTEEQVAKATERFVDVWLCPSRATRLVVHVGNKTFTYLLMNGNQLSQRENLQPLVEQTSEVRG